MVAAKTGAGAIAVGFGYGFMQAFLFGGFFIWIVVYAIGFAVGTFLHKLAEYKLGSKVIATILGGILVGMILSPARDSMIGKQLTNPYSALSMDKDYIEREPASPDQIANADARAHQDSPEFEKALAKNPTQKVSATANPYAFYATGAFWINFAVFVAGILSPILRVKVRN